MKHRLYVSGAIVAAAWSFSASAEVIPAVCVELSKNPADDGLRKQCIDITKRLTAAREQLAALEAQATQTAIAPAPLAAAAPAVAAAAPAAPADDNPAPTPAQVAASDPAVGTSTTTKVTTTETKTTEKSVSLSGNNDFAGLKFGAGIGLTFDMGGNQRIKTAKLVNGLVRIEESENTRARLLLESHYFFTPAQKWIDWTGLKEGQVGFGPFISLQGGPEAVIQGIGGGFMLGLKRSDKPEDSSSFNIGLGGFMDLNVRTLGDDIFPNRALPAGETEIRFTNRSQAGFLVFTSFTF